MKYFTLGILAALMLICIAPAYAQTSPQIVSFTTNLSGVRAAEIERGNALIPVFWELIRRPENTNLVFEQVLPDGTLRNAELPRDFVIVDSAGRGIVRPILPASDPQNLSFQIRLVDLSNQATLAQSSFTIRVYYGDENSGSVSISNFSISTDTAPATTTISLSWNIVGNFDNANIAWVPSMKLRNFATITSVTSNTGSYSFTLPDHMAGERWFTLTVTDMNGNSVTSDVRINITCGHQWGINVADSDCPLDAVSTYAGAYQSFERGFMLWMPIDKPYLQDFWVFYNDGTAQPYRDEWDGGSYSIDETAPSGLFVPQRGFGYLWNTHSEIQSHIGWATASEQNYTFQYQSILGSELLGSDYRWYFLLPDGRIIRVTWVYMQGRTIWEYL